MIVCRCGESYSGSPDRDEVQEWAAQHQGRKGHGVSSDSYRADCRLEAAQGGCRNCGEPPTGRKIFYCSDGCRDAFEVDHFWGSARNEALKRHGVWGLVPDNRTLGEDASAWRCARCSGWIIGRDGMVRELRSLLPDLSYLYSRAA